MDLFRYTLSRVAQALPLIFILILLTFFIIHLAPGDPVAYMLSGAPNVPPEILQTMRHQLGLDQPIQVQLWVYLRNLASGNWGYSYVYDKPVMDIVYPRLLNTLMLTIMAFALQILIGIVLGITSAIKRGERRDQILNVVSITIWSLPTFWVGIIMILVFGMFLGVFPVEGMVTIGMSGSWLSRWLDLVWHAFLPVLTLALGGFGLYFRLTRASMLEVLRQDYIMTAWGKGCAPRTVYFEHAFRNAILPLVTIVASNAGYLLAGAVLIETIFSWPGVGYLLYISIAGRDYQMIQLIFVLVGVLTILSNLFADLLTAFLDPRIRYD